MVASAALNAALAKKAEAEAHEIEVRLAVEAELRPLKMDRARAFRDAAAAIARKEVAQADAAEAVAREQAIQTLTVERKHREELAAPQFHHVYTFSNQVQESSAWACQLALHQWHQLDPGCPIQVDITSYGGDVVHGMRLFDFIREISDAGHRVTTVCRGAAMSMAGVLLQAGDWRVMGPQASLMIHEVSFLAIGKVGEVEDTTKWAESLCDHIVDIFVRRSGGKLTTEYIKDHYVRKDWFLDAKSSLALGLIDAISPDIFVPEVGA